MARDFNNIIGVYWGNDNNIICYPEQRETPMNLTITSRAKELLPYFYSEEMTLQKSDELRSLWQFQEYFLQKKQSENGEMKNEDEIYQQFDYDIRNKFFMIMHDIGNTCVISLPWTFVEKNKDKLYKTIPPQDKDKVTFVDDIQALCLETKKEQEEIFLAIEMGYTRLNFFLGKNNDGTCIKIASTSFDMFGTYTIWKCLFYFVIDTMEFKEVFFLDKEDEIKPL